MKKAVLLISFLLFSAFSHGGPSSPSPPAATYQGPCDLVTCVEAWSVTRGMLASYSGNLFQLYNGSSTLDIGQTAAHVADMTTWSAFCSGVASNCVISKIYAQINAANQLVPSTRTGNQAQPNCTASNTVCAAPFVVDGTTGLPIIHMGPLDNPEYYIGTPGSDDTLSTGINIAYPANFSLGYVGQTQLNAPNGNCCGSFGMTHKWSSGTSVPDFMAYFEYGQSGFNRCATSTTYCAGAEEESVSDQGDYLGVGKAAILIITDLAQGPAGNERIRGTLNNTILFDVTPGAGSRGLIPAQQGSVFPLQGYFHLAGGGDLSKPDATDMREAFATNTEISPLQVLQLTAQISAFYAPFGLTFP